MEVFGRLEALAASLYPYRWFIALTLAVVVPAAIAAAWRAGFHRAIAAHPVVALGSVAVLLTVASPVGWYTLSPLFERSRLEEESPLAAVPVPAAATPATEVVDGTRRAGEPAAGGGTTSGEFRPIIQRAGEFEGADDFHFGRGRAQVIEAAPRRFVLRFEDFSVRNGPDLFVYLARGDGSNVEGALNLGALKATDGAFNYEVPEGTDVSQYGSAIVWCRRFGVLFARAVLVSAEG